MMRIIIMINKMATTAMMMMMTKIITIIRKLIHYITLSQHKSEISIQIYVCAVPIRIIFKRSKLLH